MILPACSVHKISHSHRALARWQGLHFSETVLTVLTAKAGKTVGNGSYPREQSCITGLKPGVNEINAA